MKKDLAFAFLLLLSLIAGGTLTFFAYTQPQIKLNPAFEGNALTTTSQLNEKIEKELFDLFREYEGIGGSLKQAIKEAYIFGLDGQGKGIYYHNPSVLGAPPNLKEDDDYNRVISKEGASVYFLPSAFENEYAETYLSSETETENPFSHLKSDVYEDFNRSSVLFDLMKPNLRKEISFIRYASRSGFLFTYPYVSYDKSYDFTEDHWYQSGISGAKDIVFAIDTSGSLNVSHFEAIKNATGQIIDSLSSTDRFSIVAFSDRINKLSPRLLVATEANKELAVKFIENLRLGGLSDLSGGTTEALNIISNFGYRRNERILLTFTDGYPNSGVIGNESLAETINKENGVAQAKLVYFGVNDKVNLPLLTFLENATDGQFQLANSSDLILDLVPQYSSIIGESHTEFVTWSAPKIDAKMRRIEVNLSMSVVVQDKVVGILNLEIDLNPFLEILKENMNFAGQESFVITVGRSTFAHLDYQFADLRDPQSTDVPKQIEDILFESPDFDGSYRSFLRGTFQQGIIQDIDGNQYYLVLSNLGQTGLTLGTTIPRDVLIPKTAVEKLGGLEATPETFTGMLPVFGASVFVALVIFLLRKRLLKEVDDNE